MSSLALNSEGDFATTKTGARIIAKFQRADGKIPHEIARVPVFDWFKAIRTRSLRRMRRPLYLVAVYDYVSTKRRP